MVTAKDHSALQVVELTPLDESTSTSDPTRAERGPTDRASKQKLISLLTDPKRYGILIQGYPALRAFLVWFKEAYGIDASGGRPAEDWMGGNFVDVEVNGRRVAVGFCFPTGMLGQAGRYDIYKQSGDYISMSIAKFFAEVSALGDEQEHVSPPQGLASRAFASTADDTPSVADPSAMDLEGECQLRPSSLSISLTLARAVSSHDPY